MNVQTTDSQGNKLSFSISYKNYNHLENIEWMLNPHN